ncbi:myelin-associated glycoprotein [Microcaecilia unicolor]|uniref:Myelin-associated glycoprotein-like n=1 Tax=Microcaecilia unicolor TaxID=1415580 RepID=A0A6P7YVH2_9AMPH|nr:myelin-associated glycoprotein-like [Microcaecilia unicolor]
MLVLKTQVMMNLQTTLFLWLFIKGVLCGQWAAWMPQTISALQETCVAIPCKFDYPEELRPSSVHGIWYFNSPYPKNHPPVVLKSKTSTTHETYQGRTKFLGELQQKNCSLQIDRITADIQGKYYFRADLGGYNQYTYSEHSILEIMDKPSVLSPTEILVDSEIELTCLVPDNCPTMKPSLSWLGVEGLRQHSIFGRLEEDDGTWTVLSLLRFLPSEKNNGHRVGCKVSYPDTVLEYHRFLTLDVKHAPKIVDVNSSLETTEGAHVVLVCVVESNPISQVTWLKYETILKQEASGNLTLELDNVSNSHDGIYTCVAENEYGKVNKSLGLAVMYAPWKPTMNSSALVVEGDYLTIFCSSQGNPEPIMSIMKDQVVLKRVVYESEILLEIPVVNNEDDGEYWCTAENQYGYSNSSFNLTVEFAPIVLPDSKCTGGRDTIQCICVVKSNPESTIVFELPNRNLTINETDRGFVYSQRNGYTISSVLSLRGEMDSEILIFCSATNLYGTKMKELPFQTPSSQLWAKFGPVGAVFAFVILIAVGGYMIKSRKKDTMNESSSFIQPENPPVAYCSDYKTQKNLEKSENEFHSISDKMLLNQKERLSDLDVNYANIDFSKLCMKDSYTSTEELAEYAEIRVK